jgi:hypothetical protein
MNQLIAIGQVRKDEDQIMKDIIASKGGNLPANIEEITAIFEFTDFKAKAWKILANKISKLEEQAELYQSAQRSAQQWGIAAIYAQKRMGEITKDIPAETTIRNVSRKVLHNDNVNARKHYTSMNQDGKKGSIPTATWRDAERMAKNPEIVDRVVDNAKKKGFVPTTGQIINTIRVEKTKEINYKARERGDKKIVNETTTATKDYYDLLKGFESGIKTAIINAEVGKFAPEGKNFMIKKHDNIRALLKKLEECL